MGAKKKPDFPLCMRQLKWLVLACSVFDPYGLLVACCSWVIGSPTSQLVGFYAPNFEEGEMTYWFAPDCLSVLPSVRNTSFLKNHNCWGREISYIGGT